MMSIKSGRFLALMSYCFCALTGLFVLGGCGEEESSDKTPPDYTIAKADTSHGKYRFGVTDTLSIGFNEKIDTAALSVDFTPSQGIDSRWQNLTRLLIFGKNKNAGSAHFTVNAPFSATLTGLKDMEGNGRSAVTVEFTPYCGPTGILPTPCSMDTIPCSPPIPPGATAPVQTDSLITEGRLDFLNNLG